MPISPWYCKPEEEFNFSSCSEWNKFLKRFSGSTKECATEDQTLKHDLVNISFVKIAELGFVGKCVKHSFRIYMGCCMQICTTKKLRPVNKNLSKVHFFHILSVHAKGLTRWVPHDGYIRHQNDHLSGRITDISARGQESWLGRGHRISLHTCTCCTVMLHASCADAEVAFEYMHVECTVRIGNVVSLLLWTSKIFSRCALQTFLLPLTHNLAKVPHQLF